MSHMWPVSDAGMGAVAYSFEFLMGYMGGPSRWRTMPWMVTIFGILVIPLGLSHIALVMSQPVSCTIGARCASLAAGIMLPMIPLEVDEVVAMGQHVRDSASARRPWWIGLEGLLAGRERRRQPTGRADATPVHRLPDHPMKALRASIWGFTATPWLLASAALGIWLLFAPAVFDVDITSGAADVAHIGGAAVTVCAVVAMGEVVRAMRWLNVAIGLGVAGLVWLTGGGTGYSLVIASTGIAIAAAAVPVGPCANGMPAGNASSSDRPGPAHHRRRSQQHRPASHEAGCCQARGRTDRQPPSNCSRTSPPTGAVATITSPDATLEIIAAVSS